MKTIILILLVGILISSCKKDKLYLNGEKAWPDSTLVRYNDKDSDLIDHDTGLMIKEPLTVVSSQHTALYDGYQYICHDSNNPHILWIFAYNQLERYDKK